MEPDSPQPTPNTPQSSPNNPAPTNPWSDQNRQPAPRADHMPPGRVISIIGLVLPFVGVAVVGLVLSIIGLVKSKKAGKTDVIAIIGLVINALAIIIVVLLVALFFGTLYGGMLDNVDASQRRSDAYSISDIAETYYYDNDRYPRIDSAGFAADIAQSDPPLTVESSVIAKINPSVPSAAHPDRIKLEYCGGADQESATGLVATYWDEYSARPESLVTGIGCDEDENSQGAEIQDGSNTIRSY